MDAKVRRALSATLNLLIGITLLVLIYTACIRGIEIRFGTFIPAIGKTKLTCNKPKNPFLFLCVLLAARALFAKAASLICFRDWLRRNRRSLLLALLIAVIAGLPRLWKLGGTSLAPDELLWVDRGDKLVKALVAHQYKKATMHLGHPGVVPAALIGISCKNLGCRARNGARATMRPITAARFPIALIGTATCVLLFVVGRHAFGNAVSFWGAVFLSLYPSHIGLSRIAHIDSTLTLFFMLSLLCYLISTLKHARGWKIASALFFGLAMLTKSPALIIPIILIAWKMTVRVRDREKRVRFWEIDDLAWLGLGCAIYFSLFTKLWYETREINWSRYIAWFPPPLRRLMDAVNTLGSFPWLQVTCVLAVVVGTALIYRRSRRTGNVPISNLWRRILLGFLVVLLCLSFIQVFHKPIANELLHVAKACRVGAKGHLKYWMGVIVSRPPGWFYVFMLIVCTPPVMLFLGIFGIARAGGGFVYRERRWPSHLMCVIAPLIFIAVMSRGNKMGFRYIDPIIPFVCLLSAIGLDSLIDFLSTLRIVARSRAVPTLCAILAAVLIGAPFIVVMNNIAPEYSLYFNMLAGGPKGVSTMLSISHAEGVREAVAYLKKRVRAEDSIYATGLSAEFRYHWEFDAPPAPGNILINRTLLPHADWMVISLRDREMNAIGEEARRILRGIRPVYTVSICGMDLVDIYKLRDVPMVTGEVYHPADMKSNIGERVEDTAANYRRAIMAPAGKRGGFLVHGPYIRYAPGRWRARYRIKSAAAAGDAAIARISVTGISARDTLCSLDVRAADIGTPDVYGEIPLEFSVERPRRLQFWGESLGTADLYVDSIKIERP